ncbi:class I SAM-dependent DNA methyltransferase [Pseudovibrio sp. SPO723]|uniref:class I SAM-dependent DNA methyltransferase n=1 Tax=Nesiotobacter zosterae TaxID=392721 RepID=UPI0029C17527|nr:DNA methyltransferase [Pseudovibrio sp. SPO723]MDX5591979.1 DNA methyltransferase [Pseudovibrio sp. SPO723]
MNVVDVGEAFGRLFAGDFDPKAFPIALAEAIGTSNANISKLKSGAMNRSDLPGGTLLNGKFHFLPAESGKTEEALETLCESKATKTRKVRVAITTDGTAVAARDMKSGEARFCDYAELKDNFGFFLPLAGFERFKAADENPVDIRATSHLAKLYDALIKANPEWGKDENRHVMNQFMTRIVFCLFAEDTGILPDNLFARCLTDYGGNAGETAQEAILAAFTAMATPPDKRNGLPKWADDFPYVNGGLFSEGNAVPVFSRTAFQYLKEAAGMDWKEINPDIFGSMIQSIADPKARSELGMHYTSVPNILKVIGPLFLDDLDEAIEKAWTKASALRAVLQRISKIRVFDPACGSGNFLVVSYRELRDREIRILKRLEEIDPGHAMEMFSAVSLSNFHGIEITDFAAETAKLALFIAEYQANARFADVFGRMPPALPLRDGGHIVRDNALRVNWDAVCPPPDLLEEVYIAGNPPFLGKAQQDAGQKADMDHVFDGEVQNYRAFDLVAAWYFKAANYIKKRNASAALVATNSICQGASSANLWPHLLGQNIEIGFAHRSFKWRNNAAANAAVICVIVGMRNPKHSAKRLFHDGMEILAKNINPYLIDAQNTVVRSVGRSIFGLPFMAFGCMPYDAGNLLLSPEEKVQLMDVAPEAQPLIKRFMGSQEVVRGIERYCLWISDDQLADANAIPEVSEKIEATRTARLNMKDKAGIALADRPHQFREHPAPHSHAILVPSVTSERRPYLPVERVGADVVASNLNQVLYDAPDWCLALIASKLHLVWIATVCGKLKSDFRYSSTLGWNTFPVPDFTDEQKASLEESAREILLVRADHHPKTIAQLYDPKKMPDDLRQAHRRNDVLLESMYIGRPFRNDTERLEHLFKRYADRVAAMKKGA